MNQEIQYTTPPVNTADTAFRALYETEWAWRIDELGTQQFWTTHDIDSFLPDVSPEAQERRRRRWEQTAADVRAIDRGLLSRVEATNYDVYLQQLDTLIAQQTFRMYERPANADTSFWNELVERGSTRLPDQGQARRYLDQLRDIPSYVEQNIANMRSGLARGFAPPRVTMTGREASVRTVVRAAPEDTAFYAGFASLASTLDETVGQEMLSDATEVITQHVQPAFVRLLEFLETEYLPHLPIAIGAVELHGEEFYAAQLREFTTLDLGPQEVFDIGMREVRSIHQEMVEVATPLGMDGDVDALLHFMRADPQFYVDTPEALLKEAAWQAKKFDAKVHQYFGHVPRQRFAIVEPPPDVAPYYTFGRGGLDQFTLNTYGLENRPLYSLPALTLHEGAPGHAFQIPLALEQVGLPEFRRNVYISAYGEGWALYCERLGVEMGIYATPYEYMGMLSYQMWRASRLVVDPGIHAFGWSREKAQDFLRTNTAIGEHEIVTEIDRYIAWPGQAASYYLGQLTIQDLRHRTQERLGQDFDLRAFHDLILSLGSVPLTVMEKEVLHFIDKGGVFPLPDARNEENNYA